MLSRFIIKRFSHIHTSSPQNISKCYENIHKLNYLREDVNEIKNILQSYHEPLKVLYVSNVMFGIINMFLLFKK
jgi:hypothetical protein